MNRTKKFLLNTVSTAAYQLIAMLMGFVTPQLMIRCYSSEVNGLIVSLTEFISYFKLVEAGLAATAVYSLYKPLADRDHGRISAVVSAARTFYNATAKLFVIIICAFAVVYPFVVKVDSLSELSVFLLAIIMGLSGTLEFLTLSRYRVLLTADQKTYVVSLAGMVSLLVQTALIVVLSLMHVDILIVRLAAGLTILLRTFILQYYVKKHYAYVDYHAAPDKSALAHRYDALYNQLTVSLQQSLGVVLATVILRDSKLVSVYGVYHMVIIGLWGVLKMMTTGSYSFFGELIVKKSEQLKTVFRDFECLYINICIVIYGTALVMMMPFVTLYAGNVQDVNYLRPLWCILFVMQGVSDQIKLPLDLMVTAAGAFRETRHYNTLQIAIAFILGTTLGILYGVEGILTGIIVANVVRGALQLYYVPKNITHLPWQHSFWRMLRVVVTILLAYLPTTFISIQPDGFVRWAIQAVGVALYFMLVTGVTSFIFDSRASKALVKRAMGFVKR